MGLSKLADQGNVKSIGNREGGAGEEILGLSIDVSLQALPPTGLERLFALHYTDPNLLNIIRSQNPCNHATLFDVHLSTSLANVGKLKVYQRTWPVVLLLNPEACLLCFRETVHVNSILVCTIYR